MISIRNFLFSLLVFFSIPYFGNAQSIDPPSAKPAYGKVTPICDCGKLMDLIIPNTTIISSEVDPKTNACNVFAIVNHPPAKDSVKIWVALPIATWNGRFRGTGGGGLYGGGKEGLAIPLSQGFATGATNTGHDGSSGAFALNQDKQLNWQLIQDNAYLGIHDMTVLGKDLVKAFYGKPAKYAYFVGGSTGGRQGLSEVQRYPNDYNGVLSFFPAINWHKFLIAELWPQVVMNEMKYHISNKKFEAINKAIIDEVDAKDGHLDGVIENPLSLNFDFKTLLGKTIGESEFTEKDAEVIKKIWEGPKTADGEFLWYGLLPGTNFSGLAATKSDPLQGNPFTIPVEWARYFLRSDPNWDGSNLTMDAFQLLWNQSVEEYGSVFGTDNPDLNPFKNNGGKVLIIHGLSDRLIFPQGAIHYYKSVTNKMGGPAKTLDFARLFLIPGMGHSESNPLLQPVKYLDAIMLWVEENKSPTKIQVEHRDKSGKLMRTAFYGYYK